MNRRRCRCGHKPQRHNQPGAICGGWAKGSHPGIYRLCPCRAYRDPRERTSR